MNRAEKLEELLSSKPFDKLTASEKELVLSELESEEQYEAMRKIGITLAKKTADLSPDPQILISLQRRMGDGKKASVIYEMLSWQAPAYMTVLLIGVFSAVTWFISKEQEGITTLPITLVKTDTVYLASKPDTVFREKIIYRYPKLKTSTLQRVTKTETIPQQRDVTGVNMKAYEELENLLVSGSK